MMKTKTILTTTHACLQTLGLLLFIVGISLQDLDNWIEYFIPIGFFTVVLVQSLGTVILYLMYGGEMRKKYLKSIGYIQLLGTTIMIALGTIGWNFMQGLAGLLFVGVWMFIPMFQFIWCFFFSWNDVFHKEIMEEYV